MELPEHFQFDAVARRVDVLPATNALRVFRLTLHLTCDLRGSSTRSTFRSRAGIFRTISIQNSVRWKFRVAFMERSHGHFRSIHSPIPLA
jgi:hypothetical protein